MSSTQLQQLRAQKVDHELEQVYYFIAEYSPRQQIQNADDIINYLADLKTVNSKKKKNIAMQILEKAQEKYDSQVVELNGEELFNIVKELYQNYEHCSSNDSEEKARLNNFNYFERQELYQLNNSDEESNEDEDGNVVNRIEDVFIQPNDFIFENTGNIRDHYRIGQIIG